MSWITDSHIAAGKDSKKMQRKIACTSKIMPPINTGKLGIAFWFAGRHRSACMLACVVRLVTHNHCLKA
jgi:hypothetical protein